MQMYTIREVDGNYVSEMSFSKHNVEGTKWVYSTCSGKCALSRFVPCIESTYSIIKELTEKAKQLGIHKQYEPVLVDKENLPWVDPTRILITI